MTREQIEADIGLSDTPEKRRERIATAALAGILSAGEGRVGFSVGLAVACADQLIAELDRRPTAATSEDSA